MSPFPLFINNTDLRACIPQCTSFMALYVALNNTLFTYKIYKTRLAFGENAGYIVSCVLANVQLDRFPSVRLTHLTGCCLDVLNSCFYLFYWQVCQETGLIAQWLFAVGQVVSFCFVFLFCWRKQYWVLQEAARHLLLLQVQLEIAPNALTLQAC